MYVGRDFSPAETSEDQVYGFDFVNDLDDGATLEFAAWTLTVRKGTDAGAASHLVGLPVLVTPEGTARQTATTQRIKGLLPNVLYTARALGVSSNGNTLSLWSHIQGEPVE